MDVVGTAAAVVVVVLVVVLVLVLLVLVLVLLLVVLVVVLLVVVLLVVVVLIVVVVMAGASVVGCSTFACPLQVPTFPAWSTATSSTVCAQQEALKVTMMMFSPAAPTCLLVFSVPFPWRTETESMPVPFAPSVSWAENCHWAELQRAELEGQSDMEII